MKSYCIVVIALVAASSVGYAYEQPKDFDINAVVNDKKALQEFVDCFTGKTECSPLPAKLKADFVDAIQDACTKCTPEEKHVVNSFFKALKDKLPEDLEVLSQKFDPERKYLPALNAAIEAY